MKSFINIFYDKNFDDLTELQFSLIKKIAIDIYKDFYHFNISCDEYAKNNNLEINKLVTVLKFGKQFSQK